MDDLPLYSWERLQPATLFKGLPESLESLRWVVVTAAFLLVLGGHLWAHFRLAPQGRSVLREWYLTVLVIGFIVSAPVLLRVGYTLSDSLTDALGEPTPASVTRKLGRLSSAFPDLEAFLFPTVASEHRLEEFEDGAFGYANAYWYEYPLNEREVDPWLEDGSEWEPSREIATEVATESQVRVLTWGYFATTAFLSLAGAVAWFADAARFVGLHAVAFLVPLAVAAVRTETFRGMGVRLILVWTTLVLWPLAWNLGHVGTKEIFDSYVAHLEGEGGEERDGPLCWDKIDDSFKEPRDFEPPTLAGRMGMRVPSQWVLYSILGSAGLAAWICIVCAGGPWVLHRLFRYLPIMARHGSLTRSE
ncbi:MAG: hypothetical protein SFV32_02165 [Opitutaceae bacterium]|nr:hypothetical protein [Opitutaceae bacterium]